MTTERRSGPSRAPATAGREPGTLIFSGALLFLAFVGGALLMLSDTLPAKIVRDAHKAGAALYERTFRYRDRYATDLWSKARTDDRGVTVHDADRVFPGLTLYTSGDTASALLIDPEGRVLHRWSRPYSTVWDQSARVRDPVPDDHVYFRKAMAMSNGDLIALYEGVGDSPYGYGMARLTPDSEVVWRNMDNLHHDFDPTPDGGLITLAHGYRHEPLRHADQFEPPILEDFLVVLDPEGRTVTRLSLLDLINDSPFRSLLWRIPYYSMEDPLHANGVDFLDRRAAAALATRLPVAAEGQVLVSFRELAGGSLALIDVDARRVVWATRGPWLAQHDPDVLPGGTIQVFDNRGNLGAATKSRIVEVDPANGAILWTYTGPPERPLDSPIRASHQRLPNGSTLITESSGGRLLEVTREGHVVWEYHNPVRGGPDDELVPVVSWAQRIVPGYFDPVFAQRLTRRPASPESATAG